MMVLSSEILLSAGSCAVGKMHPLDLCRSGHWTSAFISALSNESILLISFDECKFRWTFGTDNMYPVAFPCDPAAFTMRQYPQLELCGQAVLQYEHPQDIHFQVLGSENIGVRAGASRIARFVYADGDRDHPKMSR
jgi:hypothetical protein